MVHNCAIISCPLHNRRNIRKGLLFHSFPVDQHRFELWKQTVFHHCLQTLSINKHSKICYRHFHPDDYIANHTGLTRYLKATAIPSIFIETNSSSQLVTSSTNNSNRNHLIKLNKSCESSTSANLVLTSKSSSIITEQTSTNTKAKRLLSTIDKLHQIQNANKIVLTQKIRLENENHSQQNSEEKDKITTESISNRNIIVDDSSLQLTIIDQQNSPNEQKAIQENFPQSSRESDTPQLTDNQMISLNKNHLEDTLFKFLQRANLLQYYSAFIEQGGDDIKQLAEAQNDDFQEIITLVGMASKPLHVKRFKKALIDYQQTMKIDETDQSFLNNSYAFAPRRPLSTNETGTEKNAYLSGIQPMSTNNSSNWCLDKIDNSKCNNTYQLIDDNQRKMIADEAERLSNLLPVTTTKKPNGRNTVSKEFFTAINLPRDFEDRWQRIRKYSAIYNRFDSKQPNQLMSLYEILINEAAAAVCFHRPEFLTRRDELLQLARRVLQNIGISSSNSQKRPMSMLTCDTTAAKQVKLNVPTAKYNARQRDPDAFRLMWQNREEKVEQIPIEIEALRCEQNKLLQQLKQYSTEPSPSVDSSELKRQIDDLSTKIEQLRDEEKNLRRLIRKKNMRLRAKERQQQIQQNTSHHSTTIQDFMLPIRSITPPTDRNHDQQTSNNHNSNEIDILMNVKDEKFEPIINTSSPVLKTKKDFSMKTCIPRQIDIRREEINEPTISASKTIDFSSNRMLRSVQKNQLSSSTTAIDLILDSSAHSQSSNDEILINRDEQEIIESKSFIHNLDFNIHTQKRNEWIN